MVQFSRSFRNWTCADDERINITHIESHGDTLDELMDNAEISFEDWHGNCTREGWFAGDLSQNDIVHLEGIFEQWLDSQNETKGV